MLLVSTLTTLTQDHATLTFNTLTSFTLLQTHNLYSTNYINIIILHSRSISTSNNISLHTIYHLKVNCMIHIINHSFHTHITFLHVAYLILFMHISSTHLHLHLQAERSICIFFGFFNCMSNTVTTFSPHQIRFQSLETGLRVCNS